jgi:hypothetical protein
MATTTRQYVRSAPSLSSSRPGLSPRRVIPSYSLSVHPLLLDVFQQTWLWTCTCWEVCGTLVSIELLSEESLQRLSIMILVCHNLQVLVDHSILPTFPDDQVGLPPVQLIIPIVWIWAAPMLMSFAIGIIVTSPHWRRPHREETIAMVASLVALFLLEALLPVMIFVSTTMLLMRQVDWLIGLVLIGSVWALFTFLTHFIRCAVYQNLNEH